MANLYDWQIPHAAKLIRAVKKFGVGKDGSDTGVGKTVIAVNVAKQLDLIPFVICPKSVIPSWKTWVQCTYTNVSMPLVHNYEALTGGRSPYVKRRGKGLAWQMDNKKVILIFDEDHRCKSEKSWHAKLLIAAKKQGYKILLLGATSCSSPLDMKAMGYALGLHDNRNFWGWCLKNECRPKQWGGLEYRGGADHLSMLHDMIYKDKGSRIRISDLPEGAFPEQVIESNAYPMGDASKIDKIYKEMAKELKELEKRKEEDEEMGLTIQLRARQEIELLKVPLLYDLIVDHIKDGNSVIVFLNFKASLEALNKKVVTNGYWTEDKTGHDYPSVIYGGQSSEERERHIQDFQDGKTQLLFSTIQAGGVGINLHDTEGTRPRVSLICPSFSAIDLKQALGRVYRSGAKSPVLQQIVFAEGTVEDAVCSAVRTKLNNIDLINDKDVTPCGI